MSSAPDDVIQLLRQRGRELDPSALASLMRGVAAAPEGLAGPEWIELIAPDPDAELTKALTAWRAELVATGDGLDTVPAPPERLARLRAEVVRRGLDGFVVPRADEHQGEYVPRGSQRLQLRPPEGDLSPPGSCAFGVLHTHEVSQSAAAPSGRWGRRARARCGAR